MKLTGDDTVARVGSVSVPLRGMGNETKYLECEMFGTLIVSVSVPLRGMGNETAPSENRTIFQWDRLDQKFPSPCGEWVMKRCLVPARPLRLSYSNGFRPLAGNG